MFAGKRPKINVKEARNGPFLKKEKKFLFKPPAAALMPKPCKSKVTHIL